MVGTRLSLPGDAFEGLIDELDLFDRALPDSEIRGILEAGERGRCRARIVDADIEPGNELHRINPTSRGISSVANLGSEGFDVTYVDERSLRFGRGQADPENRGKAPLRDVNRDGWSGLVAHFRVGDSGSAFGNSEACVDGTPMDGTPFEGCDAIQTLPAGGLGFELAVLPAPLGLLRRRA